MKAARLHANGTARTLGHESVGITSAIGTGAAPLEKIHDVDVCLGRGLLKGRAVITP